MSPRLLLVALLGAVLAGCAQGPAGPGGFPAGGRSCVSLFRQLDTVERFESWNLDRDEPAIPAAIEPIVMWLRSGDCLTSSNDLAGLSAAFSDPGVPRGDGSRARGGALVHVGAVTSTRDDFRSLDYFEALGYHAYSIGIPGVGRRIYVGPMATDAGVQAVMQAATRAGFRYPYVKGTGSSFFGGIVQSR